MTDMHYDFNMKLERNIYPYISNPDELPIFLRGIGGSSYQAGIDRPEGYHWHQILYCAEGRGILETDGKTTTIEAGTYFYLPKLFPHSYHAETGIWDVRWVAFDGPACESMLKTFSMEKPCTVNDKENTSGEEVFDKMIASLDNDVLYCNYVCSGLIYNYIIHFHRLLDAEYGSRRSRRLSLLMPAFDYINKYYAKDISVPELSDLVGITPQHFCRILKEIYNCSPVDYITGVRLNEAKRLLLDRRFSIKEIAEITGFGSSNYFSTVFKKHEGCTASEYLKSHAPN